MVGFLFLNKPKFESICSIADKTRQIIIGIELNAS